jgi:hypothetical protein
MINLKSHGYSSEQPSNDAHSTFLFVASQQIVNRGYPQRSSLSFTPPPHFPKQTVSYRVPITRTSHTPCRQFDLWASK